MLHTMPLLLSGSLISTTTTLSHQMVIMFLQPTLSDTQGNPVIYFLNTQFKGNVTKQNFAAYDAGGGKVDYASTQSCQTAASQCQDNGYSMEYACVDNLNKKPRRRMHS